MRRWIYHALTAPRRGDVGARIVSVTLLVLIAISVAASVLQTDVTIAARAPELFYGIEIVSIIVFTIEYVLRLWSCTAAPRFRHPIRGRLKQALQPMALIDLAAIAPFYIELLLPGTLDLRFLRVLRLLRVFRLMSAGPMRTAFGRIVRVAQAKRTELGVSLVIVVVATVVAAGAMFMVEHDEPNTLFTSIPRSMWWSLVTITTIGYGDMTPTSPIGRIIAGFVAFLGICAVALPVGIISSGYLNELDHSKDSRDPADSTERGGPTDSTCPTCGQPVASTAARPSVATDGEDATR